MVLRLAEAGDEGGQFGRREALIAQQDRAVAVEGVHHAGHGRVVRPAQVHVQDLGAEPVLQRTGAEFDRGGHGFASQLQIGVAGKLAAPAMAVLLLRAPPLGWRCARGRQASGAALDCGAGA